MSAGLADSSITFWWPRRQLQSRTPIAHAVPCPSATTCTSICRAGVTKRSSRSVPSPKACSASAWADRKAAARPSGTVDATDPAAAASRGGLDHDGKADACRVTKRILDGIHRAPAPRRDGDLTRLCEPFRGDPVADEPHHRRVGAHEYDPEPLAQVRKVGILGHEAPSDPRGVRAGGDQRLLERAVIEVIAAVCAAGARAETDGLVGLAYEHRVPLDVSEQRDQHDRVAALLVELTHRMDQAHGRLAAVHDRQPREGALQHPRFSYRIADRRELVRRPRPGRPAARSCCRPRARRARCSSVRATAREWSPRGLRCVCQRLRRSPSPDLLPGTCACGRSRGAPGCGAL